MGTETLIEPTSADPGDPWHPSFGDIVTVLALVAAIVMWFAPPNWEIGIPVVIVSIVVVTITALRHTSHPFIRSTAAVVVATLLVAVAWYPIWEDFHKSHPEVQLITAALYCILAGIIVGAGILAYRLAFRPITRKRQRLDPFLAVALFGGVLVVAGIGSYSLSPSRTTGPSEPSSPTIVSEAPRIAAIPTAPDDVPKKLKAIDNLEEILRNELAPMIQKGAQLSTGGWWNDTVTGKGQELRENVIRWRDAQANLAGHLRSIRDQSGKFPDIQALYDPSYENTFNPAMERFVAAVANLGDGKWNPETLRFFMQPIADDCYKQLNNVEGWRQERLRATLELRKKFSQ